MEAVRRQGKAVGAAAVAVAIAVVMLVILSGAHRAAGAVGPSEATPLPRGAAWYSETLDTSAGTVANGSQQARPHVLQKGVTWQGHQFEKQSSPGRYSAPGGYFVGDSEPGFGDWDALSVHTLPETPGGVLRLLQSGRLEAGQLDRVERRSPLIWLAQLAAMLADDPNTPAARTAAFDAIMGFPGLQQLGQVRDPQGRLGVAVAERASNLHPLLIAAGPGCKHPYGGAGCVSVAKPSGVFELEMIFDPTNHTVLAVRTIALNDIPAAWIKAGTAVYEVSYLQGKVLAHPHIPPPPRPNRPSIQSVPWQLAHVSGRRVTVRWESGTCDPSLRPQPVIHALETSSW
jgi:hypothetical protein